MTIKASLLVAAGIGMLASCVPVKEDSTPAPLTEKNAKYLAKALKGKIAGEPVNCVSSIGNVSLIPVSDDLILYRQSPNLVYQNRLRHRCHGLTDDRDVIVTRPFGSQYCKGDLITLVDRHSGIPGAACSLGKFIPYRKPKS
ncbi:MAG: hypothetical protein V3V15_09320 [Sphingorhabdus sp.]